MQLNWSQAELKGMVLAASSQLCWGLLPIYWKLLDAYPVYELLAHRIFWCYLCTIALIVLTGRYTASKSDLFLVVSDWRKVVGIICAAMFINSNWFIYIWAVNNSHIIEASLGFYISPLISVVLGLAFLKERLNYWQGLAFVLAFLGVLNMIWQLGYVPWISLCLATSFASYGLIKKTIPIHALTGLSLETFLVSIGAFIAIIYMQKAGAGHFGTSLAATLLLIGTGVATAVPLLLFAQSTRYLSLKVIGFIQYLSPTISLLIGVKLFHEPFTPAHLVSFVFIWAGLIIFTWSQTKMLLKVQMEK